MIQTGREEALPTDIRIWHGGLFSWSASVLSIPVATVYGVSHESIQVVYTKRVDSAHCGREVFLLGWSGDTLLKGVK